MFTDAPAVPPDHAPPVRLVRYSYCARPDPPVSVDPDAETLTGADAYAFGLADAVFEGADFLEQSLLWAAAVLQGQIIVDRAQPDRGEAWDAAVAKGRSVPST